MKKLLSVLLAVLMMSVAFAQMPFRTVNSGVRDFSVAKQAIQVSNPMHATAMAAAKETYNYTCVQYTAQPYDDLGNATTVEAGDVYDWWITLKTADGDIFHFDIIGSSIVSGQTYTLSDMDEEFSWARLDGEEDGWNYSSATFTLTENANSISIVAQVVDEAGNIFNLTYAPVTFADATDTVEVVIVNPELEDVIDSYGAFEATGFTADSVYYFDIAVHATQLAGNYVYDNFYADYTYLYKYYDRQRVTLVDGHATMTVNGGDWTLEAYMMGADNHAYHITMAYVVPTMEGALDTTEVAIVDAQFTDYTALDTSYYFFGATADSAYIAQVNYYSTTVTGTFAFEDFYARYCNVAIRNQDGTYTYTTTVAGNLTVAEVNGAYEVEAYLLANDMHAYHVTMTYVIPVATDTIDVTVSTAMIEQVAGSLFNPAMVTWTGSSDDEAYLVNVTYSSEEVEGSFPYIYIDNETSNINGVTFVLGDVTVVPTNDGYGLEAYLLGNDSHCYHINMNYTVPTMADATDTIDIVVPEATFVNAIESQGMFQFRGYDENEYYYAAVTAYATQIAGSYEFADFNTTYTEIYVNPNSINVVDGHFTVTATATGYEVEAYLLGANLHCYHVTFVYTNAGINTVNNVEVNVYPNPATDVLHVEANGINRIEVIDLAGRIVLSSTQAQNTINVSSLANGIYMLRTSTTEGVNVQKIVKK